MVDREGRLIVPGSFWLQELQHLLCLYCRFNNSGFIYFLLNDEDNSLENRDF